MDRLFVQYRTGRAKPQVLDSAPIMVSDPVRDPGKLTYDQFREAVGRAMRRGDTSEIPEAAEAARTFRRNVFNPLKDKAIATEILPKDVTVETAPSYLSRVWDVTKVNARRPELVQRTMHWLRDSHPDLPPADLGDLATQIDRKRVG